MKSSEATILVLPGLGDSGPDHWQTRWEMKLSSARRVVQSNWSDAKRDEWAGAIIEAVERAEKPVMLVAHSLAVISIAHAAPKLKNVRGAFLVAPSNVERENLTPGISRDFAPIPRDPLPFPSLLVGSRNDPYCDFDTAGDFANAWGSKFIDAGEAGHINVESGHGPWPEGLMTFAGFLSRL